MSYYFDNPHTDPYFNIALEEFLLRNYDEPLFHLWQNEPCVIVGKNQLLPAEIDKEYLIKNDIRRVRRFSGGGAVYQDLGNFNLSFINSGGDIDFDSYNLRILQFLESLGLYPTTNERRALFIDNMKVSGSSQHIRGNKAIYHATLLFDSNLSHLEHSLQGEENITLTSKHVRSVRSPVTNLKQFFPSEYESHQFRKAILDFFTNKNDKEITLSDENKEWIRHTKRNKYELESWICEGKI